MNKETKLFFDWVESTNLGVPEVARRLNKEPQTVYNWRSKNIPKGQIFACQALMEKYNQTKQAENLIDPINHLVMRPTYEQFLRWNKIALAEGKIIEDWAFDELEEAAEEWEAEQNNIATYPFEVLTSLAAGSGITSDNIDVIQIANKYPASYKGARVRGDSMESDNGLNIPDGSIVVINTKWEGKPFAVKNKIYAWTTPEGDMIKKFIRRKVDGKTQGFLGSLNPAYTPIPYEETMIPQGEFVEVLKSKF